MFNNGYNSRFFFKISRSFAADLITSRYFSFKDWTSTLLYLSKKTANRNFIHLELFVQIIKNTRLYGELFIYTITTKKNEFYDISISVVKKDQSCIIMFIMDSSLDLFYKEIVEFFKIYKSSKYSSMGIQEQNKWLAGFQTRIDINCREKHKSNKI